MRPFEQAERIGGLAVGDVEAGPVVVAARDLCDDGWIADDCGSIRERVNGADEPFEGAIGHAEGSARSAVDGWLLFDVAEVAIVAERGGGEIGVQVFGGAVSASPALGPHSSKSSSAKLWFVMNGMAMNFSLTQAEVMLP